MERVLELMGVSKSFGKKTIVDDLSLHVNAGEIFGLLGSNGAGKTTTIKIITGLLRADVGDVVIHGFDVRRQFEKAMESIGAIVETPRQYEFLSGMQNLRLFRRMRAGVTEERMHEVVHLVGLENRINDRVHKYSLGMKQRLGLAQAILHCPKLLVLDEPTNGLDPSGIRDFRDLLKTMARETDTAVFVSSHMLSEMELMCDRVGILQSGRLLDVKTVRELTRLDKSLEEVFVNIIGREMDHA